MVHDPKHCSAYIGAAVNCARTTYGIVGISDTFSCSASALATRAIEPLRPVCEIRENYPAVRGSRALQERGLHPKEVARATRSTPNSSFGARRAFDAGANTDRCPTRVAQRNDAASE